MIADRVILHHRDPSIIDVSPSPSNECVAHEVFSAITVQIFNSFRNTQLNIPPQIFQIYHLCLIQTRKFFSICSSIQSKYHFQRLKISLQMYPKFHETILGQESKKLEFRNFRTSAKIFPLIVARLMKERHPLPDPNVKRLISIEVSFRINRL